MAEEYFITASLPFISPKLKVSISLCRMRKECQIIFCFLFICCVNKGQVLCSFEPYRNVAYTSAGLNNSFANTTIGIARIDKFKFSKRKMIGLLEISLPITDRFFTRRSVRKGFQIDIVTGNSFRLPLLLASSSIFRESKYFRVHDVTFEIAVAPGVYKKTYFLALDLRYEIILFRHYHYSQLYLSEVNSVAKNHWEEPNSGIGKVGIIYGLDLKRCFVQFKCGYEKYPSVINQLIPAYGVIGIGFKFGTKQLQ